MHGNCQHHGHHHHDQKNILIAFFLNFFFAIVEFIGGYLTNSVAVYSDALHDLGDSLALLLSYFAEKFSLKKPDSHYTFGYRRFSILSALANALILIVGSFFVIKEAVERLASPEPIHAAGVVLLAILGVSVNGIAAYRMSKNTSLNSRMIMLHLLEDVLGWFAILIVSLILLFKPWYFLDAVLSILIALIILTNVWKSLKKILKILMQGFPENIDKESLTKELLSFEHVMNIHFIQGWSIDDANFSLTLHVQVDQQLTIGAVDQLREKIQHYLEHKNITHSTIQFEGQACRHAESKT